MDTILKNQNAEVMNFSSSAGPVTTEIFDERLDTVQKIIRTEVKALAKEIRAFHVNLNILYGNNGARDNEAFEKNCGTLLFSVLSVFESLDNLLEPLSVTQEELECARERLDVDNLIKQITEKNGNFSEVVMDYARKLYNDTEGFRLITNIDLTCEVSIEEEVLEQENPDLLLPILRPKYQNLIDQTNLKYKELEVLIKKYDHVFPLLCVLKLTINGYAKLILAEKANEKVQVQTIIPRSVEIVSTTDCGCSAKSFCNIL